jgi:hypothetical protein
LFILVLVITFAGPSSSLLLLQLFRKAMFVDPRREEKEFRNNPHFPYTPRNPYNPINWLRWFRAFYYHSLDVWIDWEPLAWEKVDIYPPVAAYRPKPRPILWRFLIFFLVFLLPPIIYFWGHRWGIVIPHPLAFLASYGPCLAEFQHRPIYFPIPLIDWTLGSLHVTKLPRIRKDYWWIWELLYYGDFVRAWASALIHSKFHLHWHQLTPVHFSGVFTLALALVVVEELFRANIPQDLWEQLFYWRWLRDVPEITPTTTRLPVSWFLYQVRLGLRRFTHEELIWESYWEAPENAWTPEQWRRWKVAVVASLFPPYAFLYFGWCLVRIPVVLLAPLVYPFRLFWLVDKHYLRIFPTLVRLLHTLYLALLRLVLRPLNPLAGYIYPPLMARWERFNTYYWRHWWDLFIYEPAYAFLVKTELRMDFLDGEWLPQEETEEGWWLRMVRDRRYHFRLYRRLLGWYFWFPLRPLILPFTVVLTTVNLVFIRPFFTFPLVVGGYHLYKRYHRWRLEAAPAYMLLEDPLNHPRVQRVWLPLFVRVETAVRDGWAWTRNWIWSCLLPFWFREGRPRLRFFRQIVWPWIPLPLFLAYLSSPISRWLSDWFPYKPHASEMFLGMVVGFVFIAILPPLRRWAYWDFRWLFPALLAAVTLDQTMYWIPRIWTPYLWGFEFPTWLLTTPIPWVLAPFKPLLVLPFTVPLTVASAVFPLLLDFFAGFPPLWESLLRLLGSWFYHIWGWWLQLIWQWVVWPVLAKPWYHIDLWYYYALKPVLLALLPWLEWVVLVILWALYQMLWWPFWCYWVLPDLLLTSANTFIQPWIFHILYDGWCPFPELWNPKPPSTSPYWDPRWIKPEILKFQFRFPWPPLLEKYLFLC